VIIIVLIRNHKEKHYPTIFTFNSNNKSRSYNVQKDHSEFAKRQRDKNG
jgi:hypothetical protein